MVLTTNKPNESIYEYAKGYHKWTCEDHKLVYMYICSKSTIDNVLLYGVYHIRCCKNPD